MHINSGTEVSRPWLLRDTEPTDRASLGDAGIQAGLHAGGLLDQADVELAEFRVHLRDRVVDAIHSLDDRLVRTGPRLDHSPIAEVIQQLGDLLQPESWWITLTQVDIQRLCHHPGQLLHE